MIFYLSTELTIRVTVEHLRPQSSSTCLLRCILISRCKYETSRDFHACFLDDIHQNPRSDQYKTRKKSQKSQISFFAICCYLLVWTQTIPASLSTQLRSNFDCLKTHYIMVGLPSNVLPPSNLHRSGGRRNEAVSKDEIQRTLADVLDIIIQGDVGEHQFQLVSYQPTARTAHR